MILGRLAVALLLLRLSTPLMCTVGVTVNEQYFTPQITIHEQRLGVVQDIALAEFKTSVPQVSYGPRSNDSTWEAITQFFGDFKNKIIEYSLLVRHRATHLSEALAYMKENFTEISETLATLFVLVVEKVVLQVFILPLSFLFGLRYILRVVTGDSFASLITDLHQVSTPAATPTPASNEQT